METLFTSPKRPRLALGPTVPPISCLQGFYLENKAVVASFHHSFLSRAEVMNEWRYTSISPMRVHGVSSGNCPDLKAKDRSTLV